MEFSTYGKVIGATGVATIVAIGVNHFAKGKVAPVALGGIVLATLIGSSFYFSTPEEKAK